MKNFSYDGTIGLDEERVKRAVGAFLEGRGYTVAIGKSGERGVDLRATREGLNPNGRCRRASRVGHSSKGETDG